MKFHFKILLNSGILSYLILRSLWAWKTFLVLFLMAMTSFKFENGGDNRTKGLLSTRQTKAGKVGGFGKPFCCWGSKPEHELRFCSTTAVHLPFNVCSASVATASISFQLTILEEFFFMWHFFFLSWFENVWWIELVVL